MPEQRLEHPLSNPACTGAHHERSRRARASALAEAETLLQLFHDTPNATLANTNGGESLVGADGVRDLGFNVLADCVFGSNSQICKPLKANLSPVGGTWQTEKACESMGHLTDGVLDVNKFLRKAGHLVVHGQLAPTGFAVWEADLVTKDFTCTVIDPLETFMSSDGTEVITRRMISRRRLRATYGKKYPDLLPIIDRLPTYKPRHIVGVGSSSQFDAEDNVSMFEFWAAKIGDEDGKHIIQFAGVEEGQPGFVIEEPWKHTLTPVISFTWAEGHRGHIDGRPMGRDVAGSHFWLNELVRKLYDQMAGSNPIVQGEEDPKLSDVAYSFFPVKPGQQPFTITVPKTVSQDVIQGMEILDARAHKASGTSEEAAAGAAPVQFKSGIALQLWRQIVNERLSRQHQAYEDLWNQSGRIILMLAPEVYENNPKAMQRAMGTNLIADIDWKKIRLPEDSYILAFDVVSDLPKHIPAKLEFMSAIREMAPDQVDIGDVLARLDVIDLKAVTKRLNGPKDLIEKQIDLALSEGRILAPNEFQDAKMGVRMAAEAYQAALARKRTPPRAHLEACRRLVRLFKARLPPAAAANALAPAQVPAPTPPALGPATPTLNPEAIAA